MRIIEDRKLDFKDVLIVPKRSNLTSRSEVDLTRSFVGKNSGVGIKVVPVIVANMYNTGTFEMASVMQSYGMMTALCKHYSNDDIKKRFCEDELKANNNFITFGTSDGDFEKMSGIKEWIEKTGVNVCIDVANGYTAHFLRSLDKIRQIFPRNFLMVGNVCTPEMVEELILNSGADCVKVGIGGGCFIAGTKIATKNKNKNIEDIKIGDKVLTHKGEYREVIATFQRLEKNIIISINGISCTLNHEFLVVKNKNLKDSSSILDMSWIAADKIDYTYSLVSVYKKGIYNFIPVTSINKTFGEKLVYDLTVEHDHSYCVVCGITNIVVHNSVCTTRNITGVGYPQLSAVIECADAAHNSGGLVCSDGGIRQIGDFSKSFGAGADMVMCGGIFSGCKENQGTWHYKNKPIKYYYYPDNSPYVRKGENLHISSKYKDIVTNDKELDQVIDYGEKKELEFFGMSSYNAMELLGGLEKDYRAAEGKMEIIPYKGAVKDIIKEILGGMRSSMTYLGISRLKDFPKACTFIKVS